MLSNIFILRPRKRITKANAPNDKREYGAKYPSFFREGSRLDNAKLPIHTTKRADVAYLIEMKRINTKLLRKIFWRINNMQTDRQNNQCSKKTNI